MRQLIAHLKVERGHSVRLLRYSLFLIPDQGLWQVISLIGHLGIKDRFRYKREQILVAQLLSSIIFSLYSILASADDVHLNITFECDPC
jgi:hypothetical protein